MIFIGDIRNLDPDIFPHRYKVIILDPPWEYDIPMPIRRGGVNYETLKLEELKDIPLGSVADKNSAIYMWCTWPKLNWGLELFHHWKLEYVTGFPWLKTEEGTLAPRYGTGQWVAGVSEVVLIGRYGKVSPPPPPRYLGLLGGWTFQHSRKPDNLHEMAEKLEGPYLEIFARRSRKGWDSFGNEVEDTETGAVFDTQKTNKSFNQKLF